MKAYICNMFLKKRMSGLSATDKGRAAGKYRIRAFTLSLIASLFPYISQKPRGEDDDVLTPLSGVLPGSAGETRWKTLLPLAQAQSSIFKCFPVFLIFAVIAPSTCPHVPSLSFSSEPCMHSLNRTPIYTHRTHTQGGCFQAQPGMKWKPCSSSWPSGPSAHLILMAKFRQKAEQLSLFILSLCFSVFIQRSKCEVELRTWDELILTMWSQDYVF